MSTTRSISGIGLMSGSSVDGLDIAYCQFDWDGAQVEQWEIKQAATIPFPKAWVDRLQRLPDAAGIELMEAHVQLGRWMGAQVQFFIDRYGLQPDYVASHGHTIFHEPTRGFTCQIGDGAALAAEVGIPVICDFRSSDIALGGQGAPLAPLADRYLFSKFPLCLNLGGIANLSIHLDGRYIAFDTGPANQVLNSLAQMADKAFDENGTMAAHGRIIPELLRQMDAQDYFHQNPPKSLSNQQVQQWTGMYTAYKASIPNLLATACEQTARQIAAQLRPFARKLSARTSTRMMVTGGGALNTYLMRRIHAHCAPMGIQVVIPQQMVVEYKEALLMALLGMLRLEGRPTSLASVTGAHQDSLGGAIYDPYGKIRT